jgi:plastocyanin
MTLIRARRLFSLISKRLLRPADHGRGLLAAVAVWSLAGAAIAATLDVDVQSLAGAPLNNVVVLVYPAAGAPPAATRLKGPFEMGQRNIAFQPHLLIVPVGAEVAFPNQDAVRHHVYSFSPAKRFELKLYGRQQDMRIRFDKPGPVALGCNIHDRMSGFIYVSDTPYAAATGDSGRIEISGLPDGPAEVRIWREDQRAPSGQIARKVTLSGHVPLSLKLELRGG